MGAGKELPNERATVGLVAFGESEKTWSSPAKSVTLFDLKGNIDELLSAMSITQTGWQEGKSNWFTAGTVLSLTVKGKVVGTIGEVKDDLLDKLKV